MKNSASIALAGAGVAAGQSSAATNQIAAGGAVGGTDVAPVFQRA